MGTIQLHLFRQTDPDTSRLGAESVACNLAALRRRMLDAARDMGIPATARELAEWAATHQGEVESLRKRSGELKRDGDLVVIGKRHCRITGKLAEVLTIK